MNPQQSVFFVTLFTITLCSAHIGGGQVSPQDLNPQVYCGRSLARALAFLCFEETGPEGKRSDSGSMYNAILSPYYKEQESQFGWPWLAPHKARGMSLSSRGKRYDGVVNECCDKACNISELLSYC